MPDLRFWLHFVTAFTIVVAILMIGAGVHSWWDWKKEQMTAEDRMKWALKMFVLAAVVVIVLIAGLIKALAHDPAHHELDQWYSSVKQPDTGISCCGKADQYFCDEGSRGAQVYCKINDDRDNAELGRMPVANGTIIEIPQHKINKDPNPTGRAVVWLNHSLFVYCFVGISGS